MTRDGKEVVSKCRKCGKSHAPRQCPAFGKMCFDCGKNNHFSNMCLKKKVSAIEKRKSSDINVDYTIDDEPLFLGAVNNKPSNANDNDSKTFVVEQHSIKFKINTGSQVNIFPLSLFLKLNKAKL